MSTVRCCAGLLVLCLAAGGAAAQWVTFSDETGTRLVAGASVGVSDTQEKDYAWADVDLDGDIDLVVVRKQPFTSAGKDTNVLFINENGVLTDRTSLYAVSSDVGGDNGFMTPTNDRDVRLVDVNLDGWPDIVTATTISGGDPKHIGHPRIYMNQCCDNDCSATSCATTEWSGFRYEEARIPEMLMDGLTGFNPCFCSVSAGDLTGDGYPELYFGDYDSGGGGQPGGGCFTNDFNDRLLLNAGVSNPGFFTDVTASRFTGLVPGVGQEFEISAFGAANAIVDINNDTKNDVVKQTSLSAPTYVGTAFNDAGTGFFDTFDNTYGAAPYFVSTADLNNDNLIDMVITDDGGDRYLLNDGNGGDTVTEFVQFPFSFDYGATEDQGFGSNSVIADLDKDGWNDVLIADVDVDIPGDSRRMQIYKNLGGSPGDLIVLQEQTAGFACQAFLGNPDTCVVASIPADQLTGVHDVAVFDVNGDTWLDMVLGRTGGTVVWMNQPAEVFAGSIDGAGGSPLMVDKAGASSVLLSWGGSCILDDNDYSIYEGRLEVPFNQHFGAICSTGGSTMQTITSLPEDSNYYLVVPHNGAQEGAYGFKSNGVPRVVGVSQCRTQLLGVCP